MTYTPPSFGGNNENQENPECVSSREGIKGTDADFAVVATKVAAMKDVDYIYLGGLAPQMANVIIQLRQGAWTRK